ncbi:MAG: hypothetical protein K1X78_16745 [Verrucomicrobiaceae bacterium]|nr:hypothetical protein [Verrucomicrobiaceae bacterium]
MTKKLIIAASLVALFVFGGVCGFAVAVGIVKRTLNEEHFIEHRISEDTGRLKLTPEQVAKARPSYDQLRQDLGKAKADAVLAIVDAAVKQARELAPLLTPEQQKEFKILSDERRLRFEKKAKP